MNPLKACILLWKMANRKECLLVGNYVITTNNLFQMKFRKHSLDSYLETFGERGQN